VRLACAEFYFGQDLGVEGQCPEAELQKRGLSYNDQYVHVNVCISLSNGTAMRALQEDHDRMKCMF
jgi:hypothetical protein